MSLSPADAQKKKLPASAGLRKTVKPAYGYDPRSVFMLCTGAAAPKAPLGKGSLGCCAKSKITQYTERSIEVHLQLFDKLEFTIIHFKCSSIG